MPYLILKEYFTQKLRIAVCFIKPQYIDCQVTLQIDLHIMNYQGPASPENNVLYSPTEERKLP